MSCYHDTSWYGILIRRIFSGCLAILAMLQTLQEFVLLILNLKINILVVMMINMDIPQPAMSVEMSIMMNVSIVSLIKQQDKR